ncbi:MAG: FeoA family protein [Chthoniobacteraceae bacterium]
MIQPTPINLCHARCGQLLRIVSLQAGIAECDRLRELGFCESARVCKLSEGGAMICRLQGIRVAIGRELGRHVLVEPVAA